MKAHGFLKHFHGRPLDGLCDLAWDLAIASTNIKRKQPGKNRAALFGR
jgi:hypothetical protein